MDASSNSLASNLTGKKMVRYLVSEIQDPTMNFIRERERSFIREREREREA